jgi:acyl-CoA thioester hydrolase
MSEPTAGYLDGREHLLPVRVYYEDTDFTGVVYHANYLRYFERGRSDFLRMAGISHSELRDRDQPLAFTVRAMNLVFLRPARIDDSLLVRTAFRQVRGVRILASQVLLHGEETLTTAEVEVVCIRMDGRPAKPPPDIVAKLARWIDPPTP